MSRIRSPNYPSISLPDAIVRIKQVHDRERQHPTPREVVMKGMGYGGVNGASLSALSAALKYGLLERVGKTEDYRVSDRAVVILHPHNEAEKMEAIRAAAVAPALFAELLEHFKGGLMSDDSLRAYLVRRGFSHSSLAGVIQSFRETMQLVPPDGAAYDSQETLPKEREPAMQATPATQTVRPQSIPPQSAKGKPMHVSFTGDMIEVSAQLADVGAVDTLIKALMATKSLLPEKATAGDEETDNES